LRAENGLWLSATNAGGDKVAATAAKLGDWETYSIQLVNQGTLIQSGNQVALRTRDGSHFLSAINGGGAGVVATATAVSGWEAFVATIGAGTTRWLEKQADVSTVANAPPDPIALDEAVAYQVMVGFGSSFTESAAWLLEEKLSSAERSKVLS